MFDVVVVPSNQRVFATDMSQSIAVRDDGDVEAPVAELHRDHGMPSFVIGDRFSGSGRPPPLGIVVYRCTFV